jgi:hypothetical protein
MMSDAELDGFVDGMYQRAIDNLSGFELMRCPPLAPLPAQIEIVRSTVRWATSRGCRLPARLPVYWVAARPGVARGCFAKTQAGEYSLYLDGNMLPRDLRFVIAHELQHVHDYRSGRTFTRVELEKRADAFARQCLQAILDRQS